jgi:hypothetical protein
VGLAPVAILLLNVLLFAKHVCEFQLSDVLVGVAFVHLVLNFCGWHLFYIGCSMLLLFVNLFLGTSAE